MTDLEPNSIRADVIRSQANGYGDRNVIFAQNWNTAGT